jgi:hypothetical protein
MTKPIFQFWSVDPLVLYGPVVEHLSVENGFLYESPHQMWKDGNFKQMPWLTGTVSNDGAVRALGEFSITFKHILDSMQNPSFSHICQRDTAGGLEQEYRHAHAKAFSTEKRPMVGGGEIEKNQETLL